MACCHATRRDESYTSTLLYEKGQEGFARGYGIIEEEEEEGPETLPAFSAE